MNRLNKTESDVFVYCMFSLFLKDLFSILSSLYDEHQRYILMPNKLCNYVNDKD